MPIFFSGLPTFLEAFSPLGVKIQRKIHPQVPVSGMWTVGDVVLFVHLHLACFENHLHHCCLWHLSPFQAHDVFLQPPEAQHIWPSGQQVTKQQWTATMCREFLQRLSPPPSPGFLCSWMFALSYFIGEFCYLCEMWPGSARECLRQNITGTHRDYGWEWRLLLASRSANK